MIEFTAKYFPEKLDKVYSIFHRKGAYSRHKNLLESKDALDEWYKDENQRREEALREWCQTNNIEVKG